MDDVIEKFTKKQTELAIAGDIVAPVYNAVSDEDLSEPPSSPEPDVSCWYFSDILFGC